MKSILGSKLPVKKCKATARKREPPRELGIGAASSTVCSLAFNQIRQSSLSPPYQPNSDLLNLDCVARISEICDPYDMQCLESMPSTSTPVVSRSLSQDRQCQRSAGRAPYLSYGERKIIQELRSIKGLLEKLVTRIPAAMAMVAKPPSLQQIEDGYVQVIQPQCESASSVHQLAAPSNLSTNNLIPSEDVISDEKWNDRLYQNTAKKINHMVVELASRSFFGEAILRVHNVRMSTSLAPALDKQKMNMIKELVRQHAASHLDQQEWHEHWENALTALQQRIKYLRSMRIGVASTRELVRLPLTELP